MIASSSSSSSSSPTHPLYLFSYRITGMDCSGCSTMLNDRIRTIDGIRDVVVSIMTGIAEFTYRKKDNESDKANGIKDDDVMIHAVPIDDDDHTAAMDEISAIIIHAITTIGFTPFLRHQRVVDESVDASSTAAAAVVMVKCHIGITSSSIITNDDVIKLTDRIRTTIGVESVQIQRSRPSSSINDDASSIRPITALCIITYDPSIIGARTLLAIVTPSSSARVISSADASSFLAASSNSGGAEWTMSELWRFRFVLSLIFSIPILIITFILPAVGSDSVTMMRMNRLVYQGLSVSTLICWILATPVQIFAGYPLYVSAWRAARYAHTVNIDTLVMMSTTVAYGYSVATTIAAMAGAQMGTADTFFDTSALLLTIIIFGRYLEAVAKGSAASAITDLARLQVETAMIDEETIKDQGLENNSAAPIAVVSEVASSIEMVDIDRADPSPSSSSITIIDSSPSPSPVLALLSSSSPSSSFVPISIDLLHRGDLIAVYPGARIPTDGLVVFGSSDVDESMMTGEARAVRKIVGDTVLGSTINSNGMMHVRVTKVNGENALAGIMQLVLDAQGSTPPIQRIADRVARYFVPIIIVMSIAVFIIWYLLALYGAVATPLRPVTFALQFAIAVLVVSCPCAVGLAVPTSTMVSSGVGARIGVIFKTGPGIEAMSQVTDVVFDKTGTITEGKPMVTKWARTDGVEDENAGKVTASSTSSTITDERFWFLVGSAENSSEHVLATAMRDYATKQMAESSSSSSSASSSSARLVAPSSFEALPGRGIKCTIDDDANDGEDSITKKSSTVIIGNIEWMKANDIIISSSSTSPSSLAPIIAVPASSSSSCCSPSSSVSTCNLPPIASTPVAASSCCSALPFVAVAVSSSSSCCPTTSLAPSSCSPPTSIASPSCCSSTTVTVPTASNSCTSTIANAESVIIPLTSCCSDEQCSDDASAIAVNAPASNSSCCSNAVIVPSIAKVVSISCCSSSPAPSSSIASSSAPSCCSSSSSSSAIIASSSCSLPSPAIDVIDAASIKSCCSSSSSATNSCDAVIVPAIDATSIVTGDSCCSSKNDKAAPMAAPTTSCCSSNITVPIVVVVEPSSSRCSSSESVACSTLSIVESTPAASSSCCSSAPIVELNLSNPSPSSSPCCSSPSSSPSPSPSCDATVNDVLITSKLSSSVIVDASPSCCSSSSNRGPSPAPSLHYKYIASPDELTTASSASVDRCNSATDDVIITIAPTLTSSCSKAASSCGSTATASSCCSPAPIVAVTNIVKSSCCSVDDGATALKCGDAVSKVVASSSPSCCSTVAVPSNVVSSSCSTSSLISSSCCASPPVAAAAAASSCSTSSSCCSTSPAALALAWSTLSSTLSPLESAGCTVVCVGIDGTLAGWISLSDAVRSDAHSVVATIQRMGIRVHMLSGDNMNATKAAAREVGIDESRAIGECMPVDKVNRVREIQSGVTSSSATVIAADGTNAVVTAPPRRIVCMIGDGVNDAAVIAASDVGVAVMRGSDVAIAAADVLLMTDDLSSLVSAIRLARSTFNTIRLNLFWAFLYNSCAIPIAVGMFYTVFGRALPPTVAGLAELCSSMPVILCSIALRRFRVKEIEETDQ